MTPEKPTDRPDSEAETKAEAKVDEAIDESFPASDPPSWNLGASSPGRPAETPGQAGASRRPLVDTVVGLGAGMLSRLLERTSRGLDRLRRSLDQRARQAG
jgi:hypothetical protein